LVKGDEPDKKGYPGPPEGLSEGLTTPPLENIHCREDPQSAFE